MTLSARFVPCLAAFLLGAFGCGLSDYQSRMDKERERVQQFDETNRLLDEPIEVPYTQIPPAKDQSKAWPFDVFLRLPRGYGVKVKDKDKSTYSVQAGEKVYPFFFRYVGGGEGAFAIFIAAARVAEVKKKSEKEGEKEEEKEEKFGEYTTERFRVFIKAALETYCVGEKITAPLKETTKPADKEITPLTPYPNAPGGRRLTFSFSTYTAYYALDADNQLKEHSAFDVYVHERTGRQICIVVHRPVQESTASLKKAVEACLGTLDLADPVNKRNEYKKAKAS